MERGEGQERLSSLFQRNTGGPTAYEKMRQHFYAVQGILPCPGCGAGSPMLFPGGSSIRQRTSDEGARADGGKRELFGQFRRFGRFGPGSARLRRGKQRANHGTGRGSGKRLFSPFRRKKCFFTRSIRSILLFPGDVPDLCTHILQK